MLGEVRKTKSEAKRKLSTPVERLAGARHAEHLAALRTAEADLVSSGFVEELVTEVSDTFGVEVMLAPPSAVARRHARVLMAVVPLDPGEYADLVRRALAEDVGSGDVTTAPRPAGR